MGDSTDNTGKQPNPGMGQNSDLKSGKQEIAGNKQSTGQQGGRGQ
jgi:hypothetical protein